MQAELWSCAALMRLGLLLSSWSGSLCGSPLLPALSTALLLLPSLCRESQTTVPAARPLLRACRRSHGVKGSLSEAQQAGAFDDLQGEQCTLDALQPPTPRLTRCACWPLHKLARRAFPSPRDLLQTRWTKQRDGSTSHTVPPLFSIDAAALPRPPLARRSLRDGDGGSAQRPSRRWAAEAAMKRPDSAAIDATELSNSEPLGCSLSDLNRGRATTASLFPACLCTISLPLSSQTAAQRTGCWKHVFHPSRRLILCSPPLVSRDVSDGPLASFAGHAAARRCPRSMHRALRASRSAIR